MRSPARIAALLLAIGLLAGACGVKGPPLPARQLLPDRVSAPTYSFSEQGLLTVAFRPPNKNVRGLPLKDLGGFYVERSENRARPEFCPGCPVKYTKRIELKAVKPPQGRAVANVVYRFEDRLRPGYVYHYRIFAHDSGEDYDPVRFQRLVLHYDSPPMPPDRIEYMVEDELVFLRWPPPDRLEDGRPADSLAGYNIYRRQEGGAFERINPGQPWGKPFYEDTLAKNGRVYEYKVRAVRDVKGTLVEGPASPIIAAMPLDLTPPSPPVKIFAASSAGGVKITWPAVEAADLAGYRIYRRRKDEAGFQKIGPDLVRDNLYVDADVVRGHTYFYRVTSVDNSPAANESPPSISASVYFEP